MSPSSAPHYPALPRPTGRQICYSKLSVSVVSDCEEVRKFLLTAQVVGDLSPRSKDRVLSLGEKLACRIVAAALNIKGGIPARVINLDNIVAEELAQRVASIVSESTDAVPVITVKAFSASCLARSSGVLVEGIPTSVAQCARQGWLPSNTRFGRKLMEYFTADPSKVPSARVLATVTAEEASELTFFGSELTTWGLTLHHLFSQVIHLLTMEQLCMSEVVLQLKNVFNPCGPGTVIYHSDPEADRQPPETVQEKPTGVGFMLSNGYDGQSRSRRRPTAISSKEGLVLINVTCSRTTKSRGFLASVFLELERNGLVPDLVTTSERNVSLAIQTSDGILDRNRLVLNLQKFGSVTILENMNIVSVIGQRMRNMVGTANEIFEALASAKINIYLISQGASEINISFVVKAEDAIQAMNVIHARALQIPTHLEQENTFIKKDPGYIEHLDTYVHGIIDAVEIEKEA
ncbi:hypothetical protein BDW59DRAFT_165579 [Aspergillus cavernicola]|uniref:aspartate kinase n=1 Tax=Aspergillus cavernicola TaxID=176166 RepID=A0ABR4HU32_9EURO